MRRERQHHCFAHVIFYDLMLTIFDNASTQQIYLVKASISLTDPGVLKSFLE